MRISVLFALFFCLNLFFNPHLWAASTLSQVPEGLPTRLYNTVVVASGERFVTNDGLLYRHATASMMANQFDEAWQQQLYTSYDKTYADRQGRMVIDLDDASPTIVRALLETLDKGTVPPIAPPADFQELSAAHKFAHFWNMESSEAVLHEAFVRLVQEANLPVSPDFEKSIFVRVNEYPDNPDDYRPPQPHKTPFNLLRAAHVTKNQKLLQVAALKCLRDIPRHFGFSWSRNSEAVDPDVLRRIDAPLVIRLLDIVRGARGGDISSLIRLLRAWRHTTEYAEFDTEILPHFPFEKVPPELAETMEAAFSSYLEPKKAEWAVLLHSSLAARERPDGVVVIDADLPTATVSEGYAIIPAGEFTMGSPATQAERSDNEDQHQVRITRAFALKKTPVTVKEWRELMGNDPSHRFARPADESADDCPMQMVSWYDAISYCNRLSIREGFAPYYLLTGESGTPGTVNYTFARYEVNSADQRGYRLPREAEWEMAAQAGSTGARYSADNLLASIAWYKHNSGNRTHPVTTLQPNAFGLFHMLGNMWEWTGDWYQEHLGTALQVDPHGPDSGSDRVIRGGSYYSYALFVRAAGRNYDRPSNRNDGLGFRPARSLSY